MDVSKVSMSSKQTSQETLDRMVGSFARFARSESHFADGRRLHGGVGMLGVKWGVLADALGVVDWGQSMSMKLDTAWFNEEWSYYDYMWMI